jgi:hypothetical protein
MWKILYLCIKYTIDKFYTVYQTTNLINNKIYIGVHATKDLNDDYLGSGGALLRAIKKYGKENFKKEILYIFDNKEEMLLQEIQLVTADFVLRKDVYNIALGGESPITIDSVSVKDKDGNCFRIDNKDERYINGDFIGVAKNRVRVFDQNGVATSVYRNDTEFINGNLIKSIKVRDKFNKIFDVPENDIRIKTGELVSFAKNKISVKDKNGKYLQVDRDDPRLASGELVGTFKNIKHSHESIEKMKQNHADCAGIKNSQYGTCWVYNDILEQNKRIKLDRLDEYLNLNWIKGVKMKYH